MQKYLNIYITTTITALAHFPYFLIPCSFPCHLSYFPSFNLLSPLSSLPPAIPWFPLLSPTFNCFSHTCSSCLDSFTSVSFPCLIHSSFPSSSPCLLHSLCLQTTRVFITRVHASTVGIAAECQWDSRITYSDSKRQLLACRGENIFSGCLSWSTMSRG